MSSNDDGNLFLIFRWMQVQCWFLREFYKKYDDESSDLIEIKVRDYSWNWIDVEVDKEILWSTTLKAKKRWKKISRITPIITWSSNSRSLIHKIIERWIKIRTNKYKKNLKNLTSCCSRFTRTKFHDSTVIYIMKNKFVSNLPKIFILII